jgi:hypothetical protein
MPVFVFERSRSNSGALWTTDLAVALLQWHASEDAALLTNEAKQIVYFVRLGRRVFARIGDEEPGLRAEGAFHFTALTEMQDNIGNWFRIMRAPRLVRSLVIDEGTDRLQQMGVGDACNHVPILIGDDN